MAGSMEGEVKITPRNSRGWRAVTETLTSIRAEIVHLQGALEAANADNERLRAALGAVEWVEDSEPDFGKYCPWCGNFEKSGHAHDCQRQAALKEGE